MGHSVYMINKYTARKRKKKQQQLNSISTFRQATLKCTLHYTMPYKYGKRTRQFLGRFYFHFSLVFYNYEAFLIKQLFHSRLLDMR